MLVSSSFKTIQEIVEERVQEETNKRIYQEKIKQKKIGKIMNGVGVAATLGLFTIGTIGIPFLITSLGIQGVSMALNALVKVKVV